MSVYALTKWGCRTKEPTFARNDTCIIAGANASNSYWGKALSSATYLINRVPLAILYFQTPFDVLHTALSAPTESNLPSRVFGCIAFVHLPKEHETS